MSEEKVFTWDSQNGIAPVLVPMVGRKVAAAGLFPSGEELVLVLDHAYVLMVKAIRSDLPRRPVILQIEAGELKHGTPPKLIVDPLQQTWHTKDLVGKRFTGVEANVLLFDNQYGARFEPDKPIAWVKTREPIPTEEQP